MEKEIRGLITSFDLSIKLNELRIKAILNVLEKTNPELHDIYVLEFQKLLNEFQASLKTDQLTEYENFGLHFQVDD